MNIRTLVYLHNLPFFFCGQQLRTEHPCHVHIPSAACAKSTGWPKICSFTEILLSTNSQRTLIADEQPPLYLEKLNTSELPKSIRNISITAISQTLHLIGPPVFCLFLAFMGISLVTVPRHHIPVSFLFIKALTPLWKQIIKKCKLRIYSYIAL